MGTILLFVGGIACLVGGIMVLIEAFRESILWGLLSLFISPVLIIFAIIHFDRCKQGLLIYGAGLIALILGVAMSS